MAEHHEEARADILASTSFSKEVWRQIRLTNPNKGLNREIRRRTDVVGIFPDRASVILLVGAVLTEQHDELAQGRRNHWDEWAQGRRNHWLDLPPRAQAVETAAIEEKDQPERHPHDKTNTEGQPRTPARGT